MEEVSLSASAIYDKLLNYQRDWWRWQNKLGSVWAERQRDRARVIESTVKCAVIDIAYSMCL